MKDKDGMRMQEEDRDNGKPGNEEKKKKRTYGKFAAMIATSTILMHLLTYTNVYQLDHIYFSETRFFLSLMMGSIMTVVMLHFIVIRQGDPYFYKWGRNCRSLEKRKPFSLACLPSRLYLFSPH